MNTLRRKWLILALMLCGLLAPATTQAGGWAVVTVEHLPRSVVAEEAISLIFTVRQHGQHLIHLEDAAVVATLLGSRESIRFPVEPMKVEGYHSAVISFPQAGTWEWRFEPTPFPTATVFAPLTVLPAASSKQVESMPSTWLATWLRILLRQGDIVRTSAGNTGSTDIYAADEEAYGRALFLAKGCAGCHFHGEANMGQSFQVGPDLTHYQPDPLYVRSFLRNAAILTADRQWPMPTLNLDDDEIDALLVFLGDGKIALDR